jgi:hypothetical protein
MQNLNAIALSVALVITLASYVLGFYAGKLR